MRADSWRGLKTRLASEPGKLGLALCAPQVVRENQMDPYNLRNLRIAPSTIFYSSVQLNLVLLCDLCVSAVNNPG